MRKLRHKTSNTTALNKNFISANQGANFEMSVTNSTSKTQGMLSTQSGIHPIIENVTSSSFIPQPIDEHFEMSLTCLLVPYLLHLHVTANREIFRK